MIRIYADNSSSGCELRIIGHANFSKENDIVCSAVSVLYYTLLEFLEREKGDYISDKKENSGKAHVRFLPDLESRAVFSATVTGLEMIASEFPENVKITKRSEN